MGCWNGTCGLSQLPIMVGDRVVLIFLRHNKYADIGGGGFCYSHNQYYPYKINKSLPDLIGKEG